VATSPGVSSFEPRYQPPAPPGVVHVEGYYRSDGTYVQPHMRTKADGRIDNNWSTKGNVNPYTGKVGTKSPYQSLPSSGSTWVNGYHRKDGTYVRGHSRSK
ncbi:MAG: hypothetical protein ABL994_25990, partial [Verrucomicrobiales bacterium]